MGVDKYLQFMKDFFGIDKKPDKGLVKIGLENTITAIQRAVRPDVQDTIPTTDIILGPRTRFNQFPLKTG